MVTIKVVRIGNFIVQVLTKDNGIKVITSKPICKEQTAQELIDNVQ
jgi:hypothetical protein